MASCISVELRMTLLLTRIIELSVQSDDGKKSPLEWTRSLPDFPRQLLFIQTETLPCRLEILRRESVSLRCVPVSEWFLGIRSLFLITLLNHLPQEIQLLRLCGLLGLLLHSVFWNKFSDASNFSNSSISTTRLSPFQIPPAIKAYPGKIPGNTFFPNWWIPALSLGIWEIFHQCTKWNNQLVLWKIPQIFVHTEFSRLPGGLGHFQIAIAFHRIWRPPLIIQSGLQ